MDELIDLLGRRGQTVQVEVSSADQGAAVCHGAGRYPGFHLFCQNIPIEIRADPIGFDFRWFGLRERLKRPVIGLIRVGLGFRHGVIGNPQKQDQCYQRIHHRRRPPAWGLGYCDKNTVVDICFHSC